MIPILRSRVSKLLLILVTAILSGSAHAENGNSHSSLNDTTKCTDCHIEKPRDMPGEVYMFKSVPLRDNVTKICTRCHQYGKRSHPSDIFVDFEVPPDLPLKNGMVTCATCHYPHASSKSSQRYVSSSLAARIGGMFFGKESFMTYYLRRANSSGELCLACHGN